ncbi:MAG: outer membrane beta-barrel family protein, partial [Psychrosphaera sp.]|nr:outer membrane beta-barrel family protein [Psychrosphaera sp.]
RNSGQPFDSHYEQDSLKTEYVSRATFSNVSNAKLKPEFGVEVTNNRLDTNAQYGQVSSLDPVFGSDVVVQEWRMEAFANFVYQLNTKFTIEGGLTLEASQIKVTGDASAKQSFKYVKPRLTASYQLNDKTRLTFEAERRVGQLSFSHFAANSVADEQRTNAGNPDLAPSQTDEITGTFDWRFSDRGSLKVEAFHQWRSDILEQVILSTDEQGNIEQGLGNAGDATVWGISSSLKLPLDNLITGGLLDLTYRKSSSAFDDPIIGRERRVKNNNPEWVRVQFRQDLTEQQFSWGLDLFGSYNYDGFLVDEIQTTGAEKTLHFFVQTTRFFGVKIQLEVSNVNTGRMPFTRRFYQDTRAGEYLGSEVARREYHPYYLLSVFGEF